MSLNGVNGQNVQAIYDNWLKLTQELSEALGGSEPLFSLMNNDKTDKVELSSNTSTTDDNQNAVISDGKINIANLAKMFYEESKKYKTNASQTKKTYSSLMKNGDDDMKLAMAKLTSAFGGRQNSIVRILGYSVSSSATVLARLSQFDKDGDGYLTDNELAGIKKSHNTIHGVGVNGERASCGDSVIKYNDAHKTKINGQTVYSATTAVGRDSLSLTAEEFKKLDEYYTKNGAKADINGALAAMGINNKGQKEVGYSQTYNLTTFVSASGIESSVLEGKGSVNHLLNKKHTISSGKDSDYLFYAYSVIKNKYGEEISKISSDTQAKSKIQDNTEVNNISSQTDKEIDTSFAEDNLSIEENVKNIFSNFLEKLTLETLKTVEDTQQTEKIQEENSNIDAETNLQNEKSVMVSLYEIELLQKGIPLTVIQKGESAVQEYAKINNIEL